MFEAIDGRRSILEIIDKVKEGVSPLIRDKGAAALAREKAASQLAPVFFEKLWWYDQVVFDTSNAQ